MINNTKQPLDDNLALVLENQFPPSSNKSAAFKGALRFIDGKYKETALRKIEKEEVLTGKIRWGALADTYFMGAIVPLEEQQTASLKVSKPEPELLKMAFVGFTLDFGPQGRKKDTICPIFRAKRYHHLTTFGTGVGKGGQFRFF